MSEHHEDSASPSGDHRTGAVPHKPSLQRLIDERPLARTWPDAVAAAGRARIAIRRISGIMLNPPFELPCGPGFIGYLGAGVRLGKSHFNIVIAVFADDHAVLRVLERAEIVAEATPATLVSTILEIGERIARELRAHSGSVVSPVSNPPPPPDVLDEADRLAAKLKAEQRSP